VESPKSPELPEMGLNIGGVPLKAEAKKGKNV
jgi:hypothetical protein